MRRNHLSVLLSAFALAACVATPPPPGPVYAPSIPARPPTANLTADWDGRPIAVNWTYWLHQSLIGPQGAPLLAANPSDATNFCPNFANLNPFGREQFWITFISAMARRESNFDPKARYDEPGLAEDSIGIMQLSLSDGRIYGCAFATERDIEDPARNLDCSVRILGRLIANAGRIGGGADHTGAASYFGTLWTNTRSHQAARAYIISKTRLSGGCLGPQ